MALQSICNWGDSMVRRLLLYLVHFEMMIFQGSITFLSKWFNIRSLDKVILYNYPSLLSLTTKQVVLPSKILSFTVVQVIFSTAKQVVLMGEIISSLFQEMIFYSSRFLDYRSKWQERHSKWQKGHSKYNFSVLI